MSSGRNILMYSHDTYGLGHIRRSMAIATHLSGPDTNILILTGSPFIGRFTLPDGIDFVRIPGMIKKTNEEYWPHLIKLDPTKTMEIRKSIIEATAKTFKPELFIVDKEPLGLKKEVLTTLEWIRECTPETRTILGLRDIIDDSGTTCREWNEKGVYKAMEELYSEIWVYGIQDFFDPVQEYCIPESVHAKLTFTGYIPRNIPDKKSIRKMRRKQGVHENEKLVVVTAGGGGDGYAMMHTFLSMVESIPGKTPFKTSIITGPFMPKNERDEIFDRARKLGAKVWHFFPKMEEILAAADLVVSMGGYNTICEILSQKTVSLIIPRETPRKEQLIRAQVLKDRKLAEYISWTDLTPENLKLKVIDLLDKSEEIKESIRNFQLTGLETMSQRLQE